MENNINNYQQEKKLQQKLKEDLIFITQDNLQNTINIFDEFIEKLKNLYINKKWPLFQEYCKQNLNEEETKQKEEEESKKLDDALKNIRQLIKNDLENSSNENTKDLNNKIDKIFDIGKFNPQIKTLYNQIKNNEFTSDKLDELLYKKVKKFEETYRIYLLKRMKYKEELEIYKLRQEQILNENIDSKKDYSDINNYLNNFKIDINANDNYKKFKNIIKEVSEYNLKK
jgi:hypothetical protein